MTQKIHVAFVTMISPILALYIMSNGPCKRRGNLVNPPFKESRLKDANVFADIGLELAKTLNGKDH